MNRVGRPRTGRAKVPISVSVPVEVYDWLATKPSISEIVLRGIEIIMREEKKNELPFVIEKVKKYAKEMDEVSDNYTYWSNKRTELEKEQKEEEEEINNLIGDEDGE